MKRIGIDAIALAVPEGYVELRELAEARNVPPAKFTEGIGVLRMAVARPHEDTVALAANASLRLFSTAQANRARIGLCVVGTETAVDHSKPIAAYLHGLLQLPSECRVFEAKHACFGGTAGVLNAVDWIASGSARGRQALVVCADVARYALRSPGEPTQGAGAVAMLISEDPRLIELEPGISGAYARDVNDFWRPLYSKEAVVDGHHSVQCYLDALAGSYQAWRRLSQETGGDLDGPIARRCYHVPYGKMARKAHRHVMGLEGMSEAEADASYEIQVAPSLLLPAQIGNIYTGSLYLALASLLEAEAASIEGQRVSLFSYGSGCVAEFFAGRVAAGAGAFVEHLQLAEPLAARSPYTTAEYEAIRAAEGDADRQPVQADRFAPGQVAFLGVEAERRVYRT